MKRYLLCFYLTIAAWSLSITLGFGQSAYHGGKGDGYAMAETPTAQVGLEKASAPSQLAVYPQPLSAGDRLHIQLPDDQQKPVQYQFYTVRGQLLQSGQWPAGTAKASLLLPESIQAGVYALKVTMPEATYTKRLTLIKP